MNKLIATVTVVAMSLLLAACNGKITSSDPCATRTTDQTNVQYWNSSCIYGKGGPNDPGNGGGSGDNR